jgi:hypothetical protein
MSLEAISALLGHKTMAITLVYARIADKRFPTYASPSPRRSKAFTSRRTSHQRPQTNPLR